MIMSSSLGATAFVIFGVLSVVTLKELNTHVTEPYMVSYANGARCSVVASCRSHANVGYRMNPFIYPKCKHTVMGTGYTGIQKLRPLPGCEIVFVTSSDSAEQLNEPQLYINRSTQKPVPLQV